MNPALLSLLSASITQVCFLVLQLLQPLNAGNKKEPEMVEKNHVLLYTRVVRTIPLFFIKDFQVEGFRRFKFDMQGHKFHRGTSD